VGTGLPGAAALAWWTALAVVSTAAGAGEAPGPRILVISAGTTLVDEVYHLDADIRYELGPAAEEALRNGVPLRGAGCGTPPWRGCANATSCATMRSASAS